MASQNPLFTSMSTEQPSLLSVSFASDPTASLGVQLTKHDNGLTNEMFSPGYASVATVLDDKETLARKAGVKVGDYIVAVNGEGFRRFPPDFNEDELRDVTEEIDLIQFADDDVHNDSIESQTEEESKEERERKKKLKDRVITSKKPGDSYDLLLQKIRKIKSSSIPLLISLERYSWDSRVHSWSRFLSARNGNVPSAMTMIQAHERWRNEFFPIDLTSAGLQGVLKAQAVSEIDVSNDEQISAAVYIDFAKLQSLRSVDMEENDVLTDDVIKAFVVYTETLLARASDPRRPKTCQFVDLTGVSLKQGLHAKLLKKLYATFEPNYPETLEKMVMYPVPKIMASAVNAMLSFVNENTRKKFVITDDLFVVCKELGWNLKEIEHCGSINSYMKKHLKHGLSFVFD
ncbi:hypothetical protein ACHAW6_009135 [Cyclotella cf. meneghiniana]